MNGTETFAGARGPAMARAAEAMLQALGGGEVQVRLPAVVAAEANARELGLAETQAEAVTFAPVVVRAADNEGRKFELLFSAGALERVAEERQLGSAEALLASAVGVGVAGKRLRIRCVAAEYFAGAAYLVRVSAEKL